MLYDCTMNCTARSSIWAKRDGLKVYRTPLLMTRIFTSRDGTRFIERGAAFFDQLKPQSTQQWLTRRLERLGFKVTLEPLETAVA